MDSGCTWSVFKPTDETLTLTLVQDYQSKELKLQWAEQLTGVVEAELPAKLLDLAVALDLCEVDDETAKKPLAGLERGGRLYAVDLPGGQRKLADDVSLALFLGSLRASSTYSATPEVFK